MLQLLKNPAVRMGTGMALLLAIIWILGWAMGFSGEVKTFGAG